MCLANFDVTDEEEITLKGFLTLHEMAAEDKEGGEEELWHVARGLGYDTRLQLNQVRRYCTYMSSLQALAFRV